MCFIFIIPVQFFHSRLKACKYYFVFISLIFFFHTILYSFKESPHSLLFAGAIPWSTGIRGNYLKGHKRPFCIIVNLSDTSKTQRKQGKPFFVRLSLGEKKMGPNQLFLIWRIWSWSIWVSVTLLMTLLWLLQNWRARSSIKWSLMPST